MVKEGEGRGGNEHGSSRLMKVGYGLWCGTVFLRGEVCVVISFGEGDDYGSMMQWSWRFGIKGIVDFAAVGGRI